MNIYILDIHHEDTTRIKINSDLV